MKTKTTITIEPDGWVTLWTRPCKGAEIIEGLGDLGVDVKIRDLRKKK